MYDPNLDGEKLTFEYRNGVVVDTQTGSEWNIFGEAVSGPLSGQSLRPVIHANHFWFAWRVFYPETAIRTAEDFTGWSPAPAHTPTPAPTSTPAPTPEPTSTPEPTPTLVPTATAEPTSTPEPTPGASSGQLDKPPASLTYGWKTDFTKHSVPYSEIMSGGPPRDGIPPIDSPKFETVADASEYLVDHEPMVVFEFNGEARAYPIGILMWHEIVNDEVGGLPITVTYCPLCNTAIVFDRRVGDRVLDFGTSGNLRNSDLVMWDRQTESWWQQITGEAIIGELTGAKLTFLPAQWSPGWTSRSLSRMGRCCRETPVTRETTTDRPMGIMTRSPGRRSCTLALWTGVSLRCSASWESMKMTLLSRIRSPCSRVCRSSTIG